MIQFVLQKIQERKEAEEKLRESEEKYRLLHDNSPNSVLLIDMGGRIIDCNKTAELLSKFKRNELVGHHLASLSAIHPAHIPELANAMKRLFKERVTVDGEIILLDKEKVPMWCYYSSSIVKINGEDTIQIIFQNINDKKIAEERLRASERKYRYLLRNLLML